MSKKKTTGTPGATTDNSDKRKTALYCVMLAGITLVPYWQVLGHDFLIYDDGAYVTENPYVRVGLSWPGIKGAFTQIVASNWQPVTVLSHQIDVTLYGLNPRGHHATNVLLHITNAILLLLVLQKVTGEAGKSAFVAALFALHPLHVESVAWIAERKDVLSTFFFFLALLAYARYVQRRNRAGYLLVAVFFALGLMAKSMLVTFPFVLLLLDYWPLKRIDLAKPSWRSDALALVREKIPFFAMALVIAIVAVISQRAGSAIQSVEAYPLHARIMNAIVSYAEYALRIVWPFPLAVFYPHPGAAIALWKVALALIVLIAISVIAIRAGKSRAYLLVGWLWYLGTLAPVIGIVQIGGQAMADRYTYITIIGLFIMIAWGIAPHLQRRFAKATPLLCVIVLAACLGATEEYASKWKNTETLFHHAIEHTRDNFPAHINLGLALAQRGELAEAATHFESATRIVPGAVEGWYNLGSAYLLQNDYARAAEAFQSAVTVAPNDADAHARLGRSLLRMGKKDEALAEIQRALQLNPRHPEALADRDTLNSAISPSAN